MASEERFKGANIIEAGRLSPYWGEHAARYQFALPHVKNKTVLDIACGTGYGLGFLKKVVRYVVGVDIDYLAAVEANRERGRNASVLLGNGLSLPFEDNTFDVVTSFETLEHLHERTHFLNELKRLLRPDGLLILSTPNALYTKPVDNKPSNPFHVYEYLPTELVAEIGSYFEVREFLGQTLNKQIQISPFYQDQVRLPGDFSTRTKLYAWKALNKVPFRIRETISEAVWKKPFYPTERDYVFSADEIDSAPVLVAVCVNSKK